MVRGGPIALFGASGRTGRAVVAAAVTRGVVIRALYRASGADIPREVIPVVGSLRDREAVRQTLEGCHAVACVFGPNRRQPEVFCAEATALIISVMTELGVSRLVCQTGAMIGEGCGCRSRPMEWFARRFAASRPDLAADRSEQERLVMESGLDWLIVKPPRLTDGKRQRALISGPEIRVGMLSSVRRADLAELLVSELAGTDHRRGRIFVRSR